ncbi:MAG: hypothetical protein AAFW46_04285 [Pseudomonadota bacterium]
MRMFLIAGALAATSLVAASAARACDAAEVDEPEIRVAALVFLAEQGIEETTPLLDLVSALERRLITCEDAVARQLIENRIRVMAYRTETKSGLKDGGHADYDPETNSWFITERGQAEVVIWRRMLAPTPAVPAQ